LEPPENRHLTGWTKTRNLEISNKLAMENPLLPKADIEKYKREVEIIRLTAEQVIKDFVLFGIKIKFSGKVNKAYEELFAQLDECIANLLQSNYPKLLSLLYQIDLNEQKIASAAREHPELTDSSLFTHLILERELQKVLTRIYFRENPGK